MITENFKRRPIRSDLVHSELSGDIETAAKHGKGETPQRMNEPGWTETACIDHDRRRILCTRHLERMFQAENRVSLLNGEGHWCIGESGLSRYPSAQSRWGCLLMAVTGFCRPSGRHTRFVISPTWSGIQRVAFSERTPYACDWHCQYYTSGNSTPVSMQGHAILCRPAGPTLVQHERPISIPHPIAPPAPRFSVESFAPA